MATNQGKREALVLAFLERLGPLTAAELARRTVHERAKAAHILPTLVSMARRKLIVRARFVAAAALKSKGSVSLWCLSVPRTWWRTSEDLLSDLLRAVEAVVKGFSPTMPVYDEAPPVELHPALAKKLADALAAYNTGPKVPPGHCEACGQLGEVDGPREEHLVCHTIDCANYHGGCEEGKHPKDPARCQLCNELEERGEA